MKLTGSQTAFLRDNKEVLIVFFDGRINDLKEEMIMEENSEERNKIIEAIRENKRWLLEIQGRKRGRKRKIDTGI